MRENKSVSKRGCETDLNYKDAGVLLQMCRDLGIVSDIFAEVDCGTRFMVVQASFSWKVRGCGGVCGRGSTARLIDHSTLALYR